MQKKTDKKLCYSLINCIWNGCSKLSVLWREYLSYAANVLANSPKTSDMAKRDVLQLDLSQIDQAKE